jgi:flagellar biosynthetic protein FliP
MPSMTGLLGATALVAGLLLLMTAWLRRLQRGGGRGAAFPFEVMQRIATGPKQGLALVRCGDRVLVMSCTAEGISLVTELEGADRDRLLGAPKPTVQRGGVLGPIVGAALLLFALALPGAAAAQSIDSTRATQLDSARAAVGRTATNAIAPALPGAIPPAIAGQTKSNVVSVPKPVPPRGATPATPGVTPPVVAPPVAPQIEFAVGQGDGGLRLSGAVGIVVFMGALTLLPAMILLCTSFTRILIVLHFLRTALGTQSAPPGQLLVAIAVLLTGVIMTPVLNRANSQAIQPYLEGRLTQVQAYEQGIVPFREFMLANTRDKDLVAMAEITRQEQVETVEQLPTMTVIGAFVVGELRTAFQMGFVIFLPFVVIDLIVASVLMSMGMFMLPPVMIALPFKLLLFVLADGWTLVVRNLVTSFRV